MPAQPSAESAPAQPIVQTTVQPELQPHAASVQTPAVAPRRDPAEAQAMIDALASVGVRFVDRAYTDSEGELVDYRWSIPAADLRAWLPKNLAWAAEHHRNVIVRPRPDDPALIQLDDLSAATVQRLRPVAFLAIETSPGNFQAWVALPAAEVDTDLRRRLCRGTGADLGATGAVRIAGSINFKPKHAPNFPRVCLVHSALGRVTSRAELESLGVVTPTEPDPAIVPPSATDLDSMLISFDVRPRKRKRRAWPDYQRCLDGAPPNSEGTGADRSRADYFWCRMAAQLGWPVEAIAQRLMELSEKAQENGDAYAWRTARAAATVVERERRSDT